MIAHYEDLYLFSNFYRYMIFRWSKYSPLNFAFNYVQYSFFLQTNDYVSHSKNHL
jgi:hypothetical protein